MIDFVKISWIIYCIIFLSSCSSVGSRIKENRTQFDAATPEEQMQIQSGNIDKGFTEDMVYMAKGKPNEKTTITRNGKTIILWKYTGTSLKSSATSYPQGSLSTPYNYPTFGPNPSSSTPILYEHNYFIVEFLNGKVIGWKEE